MNLVRSRLRAELDLAAARRNELFASVGLFRALGGGWETPGPRGFGMLGG